MQMAPAAQGRSTYQYPRLWIPGPPMTAIRAVAPPGGCRVCVACMRAMAVDFTHDRGALSVDTQYMLGDSLLAAPVFSESGECSFYLPAGGTWTDIQTGEELSGGGWYTRKYDYFGMPLYAKPDSVIVYGSFTDTADYNYADGMRIVFYGMSEGGSAETKVYDRSGGIAAEIKAVRRGDELLVTVTGDDKPFTCESSQGLAIVYS